MLNNGSAAMASISGKKILVVEDDTDIVDLFLIILGENENHIDVAANGHEALEKLKLARDYDLIISDYHMPQMDGGSLHAAIRSIDPALAARMFFISGERVDLVNPNVRKHDTPRFLAKPFGIKELRQRIEEFLEQI
jgi:CheY-like chemotaxis protein